MNSGTMKPKMKSLLKEGRFTYISAIICMAIMPLHVQYLPPFLILWILFWIIESIENRDHFIPGWNNEQSGYRLLFVLFITFYLWQAAGLLYSSDIEQGLSNLFGRLSLILFPMVLIIPGEKIKKNIRVLLRVFALSSFAFLFVSFVKALLRSLSLKNGVLDFQPHPAEFPWLNYFFGADLTDPQHPSYISMYLIVSAFICFSESGNVKKIKYKLFWLFMGLTLLLSQYFISSRAGIILSFILLFLYIILQVRGILQRILLISSIALVIVILLPFVSREHRFVYFLNKVETYQEDDQEDIDPRSVVWESAITIATRNLVTGVGPGDARTELVREYKRRGENSPLVIERYNAHNQFLETLLESGIPGLIILLGIIISMLYLSTKERNIIYGIFIFTSIGFFMVETILYRLAGVSFFSLFSFLLIYLKPGTARSD